MTEARDLYFRIGGRGAGEPLLKLKNHPVGGVPSIVMSMPVCLSVVYSSG